MAGLLFAWLIASGRLEWSVFTQLRLDVALGCAFGFRVLAGATNALRWRELCRAQDLGLTVTEAIRIGLVGRFFALAVPPLIAVDSSRTFYALRQNPGSSPEVVSSVLVDRILGLSTLGGLALVGALVVRQAGSPSAEILLPVALVIVVLPIVSLLVMRGRAHTLFTRIAIIGRLVMSIERYRHQHGALLRAGCWSLVSHCAVMAGAYSLFIAMRAPVAASDIVGIHPLVSIAQAIPLTPLGLGVVDVIAEELYGLVRVETGAELILLTRGVDLVIGALSSIAFLLPADVANAVGQTPDGGEAK